jgi:hypothetical protein
MEPHITNVSLLFSLQEKSLKLGNPKVILNSEGPILTLYMDVEGSHYDIYLFAACANSPDHICIKVRQDVLLSYIRGEVALQAVIFSCPKSTFYYHWCKNDMPITIEMPIFMLCNYPIANAAMRIGDLPIGMASPAQLDGILKYFCHLIEIDEKGEENWVDEYPQEDSKEITVDTNLYLRYEY